MFLEKSLLAVGILAAAITAGAGEGTPAKETVAYAGDGSWGSGFVYATDNSRAIGLGTKFRVDFDKENLYVTFVCEEPRAGELKKLPPGKDGEWPMCDSVEIFLDPGRKCGKYIHLAAGINGAKYDSRFKRDFAAKWKMERTFHEKSWELKFTIPFREIGADAKIGDTWGLNLCRNVKLSGNYFSTWAHVGSFFHTPSKFGELRFGSPAAAKKAIRERFESGWNALRAELEKKGLLAEFSAELDAIRSEGTELNLRAIREEMEMIDTLKISKGENKK